MLGVLQILILVHFNNLAVECLIPGSPPELSVHREDKKLIDRKRQDTLEMCRIFNEETEKLERLNQMQEHHNRRHRRSKRQTNLNAINPALNPEDALRVETIVDKLYDDLLEQGQKVNYRRGNVAAKTKNKKSGTQMSGRRFNFAPSFLLGPLGPTPLRNETPYPEGRPARFKRGIIPYFIDTKTYDTHLSDIMMKAFDYLEKATCIRLQRLRERPTDTQSLRDIEWIYITNPTGIKQCVHSNDHTDIKGVQMVVFGYECMTQGDILHEMMHVLGFPHEHTRPDRDQYITILWDNIKPGYKKYFEIFPKRPVENLPYDYASVLHYPPRAFSRNGQMTILTEPDIKVGQREGLSEIDVEKINTLYSGECMKRNRDYLLKTCPSVVKTRSGAPKVSEKDIEEYFKDRIWPFGIVNYKLKDDVEFTLEEMDNIRAVINHIEKETCIEFRDMTQDDDDEDTEGDDGGKGDMDRSRDSDDDDDDDIYSTTKGPSKDPVSEKDPDSGKDPESGKDPGSEKDEDGPMSDDNEVEGDEVRRSLRGGIPDNMQLTSAKKFVRKKKSPKAQNQSNKQNVRKPNIQTKPNNQGAKPKTVNTKLNIRNPIQNMSKALGKMSKFQRKRPQKPAGKPPTPSRRHAEHYLEFARSAKPGCPCPKRSGAPTKVPTLYINGDCFSSVNVLLHHFVHTLGLDHQHNSHDRDSFLHIVWDQLTDDIKKEMKEKLPAAASVGFPYDYQSVMHYPWLQIKNGRTNLMYPVWNDGWAMGHWQGLSSTDVSKLNHIYRQQCLKRKEYAKQAAKPNARTLKTL
ncbi:uncharacterized protein LOC142981374 isoform X2 [Anticarsia gemmatalis]|uniref:uncharacterized protein LOC142981374 isoform X2 n=1 Tax=Anticarsia gemmatalis TaxID=129554 RepID=UPI003F772EDA